MKPEIRINSLRQNKTLILLLTDQLDSAHSYKMFAVVYNFLFYLCRLTFIPTRDWLRDKVWVRDGAGVLH